MASHSERHDGRRRPPLIAAVWLLALLIMAGHAPAAGADSDAADAVDAALRHLQQRDGAAGAAGHRTSYELVQYRESPGARHIHFRQAIAGMPVFGSYITVSLSSDSNERALVVGERARALVLAGSAAEVLAIDPVPVALAATGARALIDEPALEAGYYANDDGLAEPAWQLELTTRSPAGRWVVVVSMLDGSVLRVSERTAADHPGAAGQVFEPNPPVSSGLIPPPIDCDSAANESVLSGEYVTRPLPGIQPGQGRLVGEYVDLTAPGVTGGYKRAGQANEPDHVYVYPCNDDRFEEVMVYYHADRVQRLVQSLGFTGPNAILDAPLRAHAHYFAACTALYLGTVIVFGDGCTRTFEVPEPIDWFVDRGEDGDVVVHEYAHALQDDQAAGVFFSTFEGQAIAEGFADFVAAAVSGDPCFKEWVSAFGFQQGISCGPTFQDPDFGPFRNLENDRHYPEDVHPNSVHASGLIWGGVLWDLVQALGGDEAARMRVLTVALQSNFYLNETAQFLDAANALCRAEADLFASERLGTIVAVLDGRGLPSDPTVCIQQAVGGFATAPELEPDEERAGPGAWIPPLAAILAVTLVAAAIWRLRRV